MKSPFFENIPLTSAPDRLSRRSFIQYLLQTAAAAGLTAGSGMLIPSSAFGGFRESKAWKKRIASAPTARYWISADQSGVDCLSCHNASDDIVGSQFSHPEAVVQCRLCAKNCVIRPGERGLCRVRINIDGELKSLVYGYPVTVHVDPIEKKPFYHFLPGSSAYSLATVGCPLHCKFCQNWELSQSLPENFNTAYTAPDAAVRSAVNQQTPIIAFTYNEPTVFTEYLLDIAEAAKHHNIRSVLISCGFMNAEPLDDMCGLLDAIKIDLKGFDPDFYRKVCGAELAPVLKSLKQVARRGVHLEIVNLVVPTLNDSDQKLTELAEWVAGELGPDVPVHFTRFHPDYKLRNLPPTPISTLEKAYNIARSKGIRYPFVGNAPGHPGNHTYCPSCGRAVIRRTGFFVTENHIKDGRCRFCGSPVAGVWQ